MADRSQLSKNIKALRNAYGETQEELGFALMLEKTTISNYENDTRTPDSETISRIAKHYSLTVEELLYCDFSNIGKITVDLTVLKDNIYTILPIANNKEEKKNEHFYKAIELQRKTYDEIRNDSEDFCLYLVEALDEYVLFLDTCSDDIIETDSFYETIVNMISLEFLIAIASKMLVKRPELLNNTPAYILQYFSKNKKQKGLFSTSEQEANETATSGKKYIDFINNPEMKDFLARMKTILKSSPKYSDIADYYLAIPYVFGFVDNGLSDENNFKIGMEMINVFISVENPFAMGFRHCFIEAFHRSPHNVDDNQ